jgi:hypothetical protein
VKVTTREQFIALFGRGRPEAMEFENSVIQAIEREHLPDDALAVVDGGDGSAAYWDWLASQVEPQCTCECGKWSGTRCRWGGQRSDTVIVEFMPEALRASHVAAGNSGTYPHNGAERIRVSRDCAQWMREEDPEWCSEVRHLAPRR